MGIPPYPYSITAPLLSILMSSRSSPSRHTPPFIISSFLAYSHLFQTALSLIPSGSLWWSYPLFPPVMVLSSHPVDRWDLLLSACCGPALSASNGVPSIMGMCYGFLPFLFFCWFHSTGPFIYLWVALIPKPVLVPHQAPLLDSSPPVISFWSKALSFDRAASLGTRGYEPELFEQGSSSVSVVTVANFTSVARSCLKGVLCGE